MFNRIYTSICGGLLLCAAAHPLGAQPSFQGIGDLPGGAFGSSISGVSANGVTAVGDSTRGGFFSYEPIRWDALNGIKPLNNTWLGTAESASGIGTVIVGSIIHQDLRTREAFRWTKSEGLVLMGDLPGGEFRSGMSGVSANSDLICGGGSTDNALWEAFLWSKDTGFVQLGDFPGGSFQSGALNISADGTTAVGYGTTDSGQHTMYWTEETGMVAIEDIPGGSFSGGATAVSADGSVVVGSGFDATRERAFRWTQETGTVPLPKIDPAQTAQRAYATSWDGNVIVGELGVSGKGFGAFYWTPEGGTRWLTDVLAENGVTGYENWHLDRATGVSADGRTIVGYGVNPDGGGEGWVAYLGPICRADYDKSGIVDADDVAAYLSRWTDRNIFADWNYDGDINTIDLIAFLNEWASGCP